MFVSVDIFRGKYSSGNLVKVQDEKLIACNQFEGGKYEIIGIKSDIVGKYWVWQKLWQGIF